jgi:hypothetical protein
MTSSIQQKIEWLQSQAQKLSTATVTDENLLAMINVQTGVIEGLNEELLKLRDDYLSTQKELKDFMAREGFNYPKP